MLCTSLIPDGPSGSLNLQYADGLFGFMNTSPRVLSIIPQFYTFTRSFKFHFFFPSTWQVHLSSFIFLHLQMSYISLNASPGRVSFILRLATREGS